MSTSWVSGLRGPWDCGMPLYLCARLTGRPLSNRPRQSQEGKGVSGELGEARRSSRPSSDTSPWEESRMNFCLWPLP